MIRVGMGVDAHAFEASRPLVLGGVTIRQEQGLTGHSDADVVCHAVGDALLGAAAMGELGQLFPDDAKWANASSLRILEQTMVYVRDAGWEVVNIDATVIAQEPKLAPLLDQMRENVAKALVIDVSYVSIKAKSMDNMGFTGRGEGIAATAVALLERAKVP